MPSLRLAHQRIIAYQYEGDYACVPCAQARFGRIVRESHDEPMLDENGIPADAIDNEDNPVHAIYDGDEWMTYGEGDQELVCGTPMRAQPADHVTIIATHNEEPPTCPCGDGCPADDCPACDSRDDDADDYFDEEVEPDEDNPSDYDRRCDCFSCEAGALYVQGMDDAQYTPEQVADSYVPAFRVTPDRPDPEAGIEITVQSDGRWIISEDVAARVALR